MCHHRKYKEETTREARHTRLRFCTNWRKVKIGIGADENIGRVADEGGGAADIGGEDLREQEGQGVDLQGPGELDAYRDHQEHGSDVVQKGGKHRGDHLQEDGQDKDIALGPAIGFVRQELEYARLLHHPHKDHHPQEQEDDVQVNGPHGIFERDDEKGLVIGSPGVGDEQDEGRPQKRDQSAMHPFKRDDQVDQEQSNGGDPEGPLEVPLGGLMVAKREEAGAARHGQTHRGRGVGVQGGLQGL